MPSAHANSFRAQTFGAAVLGIFLFGLSAPLTPAAHALPSIPQLAASYGPCLVRLHTEGGPGATGFMVSADGAILTALPPQAEKVVAELANGERRRARVVLRHRGSLVTLLKVEKLPEDEAFCSLPVSLKKDPRLKAASPSWLVGLVLSSEGKTTPALGGVRHAAPKGRFEMDLPAGPGTPVLGGGKVVAITLKWVGSHRSMALPMSELTVFFQRAKGALAKVPKEAEPPLESKNGESQRRSDVQSKEASPVTAGSP